jgi:tRNA (guanine-N7-)-methyltransferase
MKRLRRRPGTKDFLMEQKDLVVLEPDTYKGKWCDFFGNDHPIYVELGMGKGKFITEMSTMYPDINFIGIDLYDELIRKASEKARGLTENEETYNPRNLALVLYNIEQLEKVFTEGEVERFFLNFSDPWPKNRHAHRRLTHPVFMKKYISILNPKGEIHLKTDSRSLFEFSLNSFADMGLRMRNISLDLHGEGTPPHHVFTEYEQKFSEKGMNIHRCEVVIGQAALKSHLESMNG